MDSSLSRERQKPKAAEADANSGAPPWAGRVRWQFTWPRRAVRQQNWRVRSVVPQRSVRRSGRPGDDRSAPLSRTRSDCGAAARAPGCSDGAATLPAPSRATQMIRPDRWRQPHCPTGTEPRVRTPANPRMRGAALSGRPKSRYALSDCAIGDWDATAEMRSVELSGDILRPAQARCALVGSTSLGANSARTAQTKLPASGRWVALGR